MSSVPGYTAHLHRPQASDDKRAFISISPKSLDELEDWMNMMGNAPMAVRYGMDRLCRILAAIDHTVSLDKSRGANDPYQKRPILAWRLPVRRITGRYYWGWKVTRLRPGTWMVFNESREAYYIEFGIHTSSRRVRRPVRKLALIATMRWAEKSRIFHRIQDDIWKPRRSSRTAAPGASLVGTEMQSPFSAAGSNMGGYTGGSI